MALNGINLPLVYAVSDRCCPLGLCLQSTADACRITGQEYIWKKVSEPAALLKAAAATCCFRAGVVAHYWPCQMYMELGLSRAELDEYFVGPAFLAWHRMVPIAPYRATPLHRTAWSLHAEAAVTGCMGVGHQRGLSMVPARFMQSSLVPAATASSGGLVAQGNLRKWGGPLPDSYIDAQHALTLRILRRMRAFGMKPVRPSYFAYCVPAERVTSCCTQHTTYVVQRAT